MSSIKVFVTGATGIQGGAIAKHLIANNFTVHATVRDASSQAAQALRDQGAVLVPGSWDDTDALSSAMKGCTLVFLNSFPSFTDPDAELRQARNILQAAKQSGTVKHVLYSSAIHVDHPEEHAHLAPDSFLANYYRSKNAIEQEVRSRKWAPGFTIIRGVYFMSNFLVPSAQLPFPDLVAKGLLVTALRPESRKLLLDPEDIGRFGLAVFRDLERFDGQEIDLAGDRLGIEDVARSMEEVAGKKVRVKFLTEDEIEVLKDVNPFVASQVGLRGMGNWVDLEDVKKWGVPFRTFKEFLASNKETVEKTVGNSN